MNANYEGRGRTKSWYMPNDTRLTSARRGSEIHKTVTKHASTYISGSRTLMPLKWLV